MDSENLKKKTAVSLVWNIFNKAGYQVIAFLVAIITTRILTPEDFGYIAALAIFSIVSGVLIESGFSIALVRRENNTRADYSAAFYFNVLLSIILYFILFFSAPLIADFFNMPPLVNLARVIFLALVINSFVIVPNV
ncbi:MAG: oligosaccharide flippase family protein, partial [Paludibacteraceae bacterium]|nr:oligosaccharide flippase family protein [Paludibacteraceae bacterium]